MSGVKLNWKPNVNWKKILADAVLLLLMAQWDKVKDKIDKWKEGGK